MYINLITIDLCPGQGGGGVKPSGTLEISENGVYDVYTYSSASVNVHPSASLSETYISNGNYNITGEFNGGVITVDVPATQFITETLNVSANGTYTPGEGVNGYSQVNVNVPVPQFVTEPLNITSNGTYTPGQGVDGFSTVTVDVPQSVTGYTQKDLTEGLCITDLNNSASFVGTYAFYSNSCLTTVDLPMCKTVGENAFQDCRSLQTFSLTACTTIGVYAFYNCFSLQTVSLPACTSVGAYAFRYCSSLQTVSLPACTSVGNAAFNRCKSLSEVNLPKCKSIINSAFQDCRSLQELTIGTEISIVCVLNNSNTFQGCSALTSIYVPASLVESYKAATNWTYYSDKIVGI